jgi:hypothetical protein
VAGHRSFVLVFVVIASFLCEPSHAASCDTILGKWEWFIGGEVTFNPDRSFVQQSGNSGTWECTDPAQRLVTLHWQQGEFVNRIALSADGSRLFSTDRSQSFVSATRIVSAQKGSAAMRIGAESITLKTQPDGARQLPKELPQLLHAVTRQARSWRTDAIPVSVEAQERTGPNPRMRGPAVRIFLLSPSAGTGLQATVTAEEIRTLEINQTVRRGTASLPVLFLDLPVAVRIARENGMKRRVDNASLRVWAPSGAPPVLAWMVGDKTVNAVTGEIISFDVTGYIAGYDAQWQRAAESLRMLWRSTQPSSSGSSVWEDPFAKAAAAYCASISVPTGGQREGMFGHVCK